MLVAVDIGNTNIVLGFLDGDTIARHLPHHHQSQPYV